MPDIYHDFAIAATVESVFQAVVTPDGLNAWWTRKAAGSPGMGEIYQFWFAPEYDWRGRVVAYQEHECIEWEIFNADEDWTGTRLGFQLIAQDGYTQVRFHHTEWPALNDHFRRSSYCWAMYLRVLKAFVEDGKSVPYEKRQDPSI